MPPTFKGRALITGASSGIGAIYADRLAHRGYDLVLVARDQTRLEQRATRLNGETGQNIRILPADLADPTALGTVIAQFETDPTLTMLVNNAGISLDGGLLENDATTLQRLIAVNMTAPTLLAAAAARAFLARKSGTIVNISSVLAVAPELFDGVYSGSKAYLLNLSIDLARKLQPHDIRVQAVLPGATRTEIWSRSGKDPDALMPGLVMDPHHLVDAALSGLDQGETITIPPLADESLWTTYNDARLALAPHLSRQNVADRYLTP